MSANPLWRIAAWISGTSCCLSPEKLRATADLRPEGRPLYAGLRSLGLPGTPMGDAWRLADQLREYRGDAHTASWTSAGFDATEIGMMSELYWGLPSRSYVRSRAWSDQDLDEAEARLEGRGLMAEHQLTDEGRRVREEVERTTDDFMEKFNSLRTASVYSALANGKIWFDADGDLLFSSSGAVTTRTSRFRHPDPDIPEEAAWASGWR